MATKYWQSSQTNDDDGGFLSLDLPEEQWDGLPSSDLIIIEIQRSTETKKTYALLSVAKREGPLWYDVSGIVNTANWTTVDSSSQYLTDLVKLLKIDGVSLMANELFIISSPDCQQDHEGENACPRPRGIVALKRDITKWRGKLSCTWRKTMRNWFPTV